MNRGCVWCEVFGVSRHFFLFKRDTCLTTCSNLSVSFAKLSHHITSHKALFNIINFHCMHSAFGTLKKYSFYNVYVIERKMFLVLVILILTFSLIDVTECENDISFQNCFAIGIRYVFNMHKVNYFVVGAVSHVHVSVCFV